MGPNKVSAYFTGSVRFDQILMILTDFFDLLDSTTRVVRGICIIGNSYFEMVLDPRPTALIQAKNWVPIRYPDVLLDRLQSHSYFTSRSNGPDTLFFIPSGGLAGLRLAARIS